MPVKSRRQQKTCESCGDVLVIKNSRDLERKRFCSRACLGRYTGSQRDMSILRSARGRNAKSKASKFFTCRCCKIKFKTTSNRQIWCVKCVPTKAARAIIIRYGLSQPEYLTLLEKQDGKCAICKRKPKRFVVDHCHNTLKVRGLLCDACNGSLPLIENHLSPALEYLKGV
jgi:hypothetical protein